MFACALYPCPQAGCTSTFASRRAAQQHYEAKHDATACDHCSKVFLRANYTTQDSFTRALQNHIESAHGRDQPVQRGDAGPRPQRQQRTYTCQYCPKTFNSASYKGRRGAEIALETHEARHDSPPSWDPVDTLGEWVVPIDFTGRKSFGYFECDDCDKTWTSAHAFDEYFQECRSCQEENYPLFLWQNQHPRTRDREEFGDSKGPHDADRCEACQLGVCGGER